MFLTDYNKSDEPAENILKIGSILDLTGPAASFGEMQLQGMNLAVAEINNDKCPISIELVVEDSRLESKLATTAANKLVNLDKVAAISSITGSGMALQVAPIANENKVPVLDSLSSSPALTQDGGAYYFRVQPDDFYSGRFLVEWAKVEGISSAFIVFQDSDWGQGLLKAIEASAANVGIEVEGSERVKQGDFEFRPALARIKEISPDVIFLVANPQESGVFISQMNDFGIDIPVYGSDSLSTAEAKEAAGKAIESTRYVLASESAGNTFDAFREKFINEYGAEPSSNSIRPYDALMVLNHIACSKGVSREAVYRGLDELQNYQGVLGEIEFDEFGDISNPSFSKYEFRDQKPYKLD